MQIYERAFRRRRSRDIPLPPSSYVPFRLLLRPSEERGQTARSSQVRVVRPPPPLPRRNVKNEV